MENLKHAGQLCSWVSKLKRILNSVFWILCCLGVLFCVVISWYIKGLATRAGLVSTTSAAETDVEKGQVDNNTDNIEEFEVEVQRS